MRIDIVIPAHNEQHRIGKTLDVYRAGTQHHDVKIFVAMDDCTDDTARVVAEHAAVDDRVVPLSYPRLGKGGVLLETFRCSDADHVAFVDADAATPPSELLRLAEAAQHADGAIASRWHPSSLLPAPRPRSRHLASMGFAKAVQALFRLPFADTQCGAKVFSRRLAQRVVPLLSSRDFLFDVDLLVTAKALGFTVVEVPTVWIDREGSRLSALSDARRMAGSLARLWLHHRTLPVTLPSSPIADAVIDLRQPTRADKHVAEESTVNKESPIAKESNVPA